MQVARISDGAQLGDEERSSLNRFARRLLENDLGLADLRNAAAQVTFLLGDLKLSRSLIEKVMASRTDPRDWHVYLKLEAGIRTLEDLRPIVIDIVGHFAKVKRYHAQRVCALARTPASANGTSPRSFGKRHMTFHRTTIDSLRKVRLVSRGQDGTTRLRKSVPALSDTFSGTMRFTRWAGCRPPAGGLLTYPRG